MRETNTASSASVAGLELMRLGPELTFLAWNDRGRYYAKSYVA